MADEKPIAYTALRLQTPVVGVDGSKIGGVEHILQDDSLDLFDGVIISTANGLRFVDANRITSITTIAVHTTLTHDQAEVLPEPDGAPVYSVDALQDTGDSLTARLGRMFRREHWDAQK